MLRSFVIFLILSSSFLWAEKSGAEKVLAKISDLVKFDPMETSEEEIMLFQDLAKRARELNAKEEQLKTRSLSVKAAEVALNEKLKHFDLLKQDLLKMLEKLKEKDDKQMADLVKIYTSMKPKMAAGVLNIMEMATLKEIVKRMEKRKAALILAAMEKEKVKLLSEILAKERQNIS